MIVLHSLRTQFLGSFNTKRFAYQQPFVVIADFIAG